ncbi:MAG: hypothetical protein K2P09_02295 [Erysipelotrichales bacterium]|nr:hypothetical protein [Erysipelotrichales bacterium]
MVKKVKVTYFDRNLQDYKDIEFVEDALKKATDWININKGNEKTLGFIDGSVSIQVEYQMNTEVKVINERLGGLVITNTVSGNDINQNQKFSFTLTLDDTSINGIYGELNFVDGVAVFELANGENVTVKGLPKNISYSVVENDTFGYTVTSEKTKGKINGEIELVVFHHYKENKSPLSENEPPNLSVKPDESTSHITNIDKDIPKTEDKTFISLWIMFVIVSGGFIIIVSQKSGKYKVDKK